MLRKTLSKREFFFQSFVLRSYLYKGLVGFLFAVYLVSCRYTHCGLVCWLTLNAGYLASRSGLPKRTLLPPKSFVVFCWRLRVLSFWINRVILKKILTAKCFWFSFSFFFFNLKFSRCICVYLLCGEQLLHGKGFEFVSVFHLCFFLFRSVLLSFFVKLHPNIKKCTYNNNKNTEQKEQEKSVYFELNL